MHWKFVELPKFKESTEFKTITKNSIMKYQWLKFLIECNSQTIKPDREELIICQDGDLWVMGYWINGKLGNSNLATIVADILDTVGLKSSDYYVSRLTDIVDGYIISQHLTAREAIQQLQSSYFFDCVESDGILKFLHRLDSSQAIEI